jgi:hypothetical protein
VSEDIEEGNAAMSAPLSFARDQVLLHLDYLAESAALIEGFAERAQANAALGSSWGLRGDFSQIFRILRDAVRVVQKLEAAEAAASKSKAGVK